MNPDQSRKRKKRKKLTSTGFDPGTFRSQEQNTTTELRRHIALVALKKLRIEYSYDTVLANFSQFAPLCATLHLYRTNLDLLPLFFFLYNFLVVPGGPFENILFRLYFWTPCMNFIAFCEGLLDFFYIFAIYLDFFCISFQTLEKNSHGRNLGFVPKSSVNFQFLL